MIRFLFAALLGTIMSAAHGQDVQDPGQKSATIVRTDTPPVIDGVLDDEVWQRAAIVDDLRQVYPIEFAEPTERTEIFLLYDDDALYIGAIMYDTDPSDITALNLRQNDSIGTDDRLFVSLDPFNDQRSGYFFGINPNSVRQDGLYQNVTEFYNDWDSIFDARASRFDGGWAAEFEIPFKSISFDPNTDTWGMNFSRTMPAVNERTSWMSRNRQITPAAFGSVNGFEGLNQGVGLDIVPSLVSSRNKSFVTPVTESDLEPSLDVSYRLTSSMNASLTVNTDFSATEVDDRQVNLTRFGLFFPEKRDFFLREADIFEFGNIGVPNGAVYGFGPGGQNGRPFFSRRIGLSSTGQPVDLDYGAKISGRVGNWELGLLSIRQDQFGAADADTLSVARAKLGVLRESSVGIIATDGDPGSNLDNSVAGFDFLYRNSRLPGGRRLESELWYQQSDTLGLIDEDSAFGVGLRVPSGEGFRGGVQYRRYEQNFNPALGFLTRRGVTDATFDVGYTLWPRQGPLQFWRITFDGQQVNRIDGGLQSQSLNLRPFVLTNRAGDTVDMINRVWKENLVQPFEIFPGIVIPVGDYGFRDAGGQITWSDFRRFSGMFRYVDGTFYGGKRTDLVSELSWRPSEKFRGSISYTYNDIRLPQGDFAARLVSMGIDYVFSSTLSWVNLIQYDNVTETMGVNMRLHWIPEAGRELFFVINHNLQDFDRDNSFDSQQADVTLKYTHTFRF
jgi:hypothetical protein